MHAFEVVAQTVAEALLTGQIGTPVAARVVAALTADHGRIERQLARILEACADWLGSRPDQLTAFGDVGAGQVSALARFEAGSTALVAVSVTGVGRPLLEVTVWGNRGILSWDGACSTPLAMCGAAAAGLSEMAAPCPHQSRVSLASRQSVPIREGAAIIRVGARTDQVHGAAS